MQSNDSPIQSKLLMESFQFMKQKKFELAEATLQNGLREAEMARDLTLSAIFYSALGILFKLKKDFRKSWKFYEQAEKLMPEDLSLKLISSRLLVDYFGQYDTVLKKTEKVLSLVNTTDPLAHIAYSIRGLAYLRKGEKKKAVDCLMQSSDFKDMRSAANLDLQLVGELIRKKIDRQACIAFLNRALQLAKSCREEKFVGIISKLISMVEKMTEK